MVFRKLIRKTPAKNKKRKKYMTKLKRIITLSLLCSLLLFSSFFSITHKGIKTANAESPLLHLQTPTKSAILGEDIYIFDETTSSLIKRPRRAPIGTEQIEITSSKHIEGVMALESTENGIIALIKEDEEITLTLISPSLTDSDLTFFAPYYSKNFVIDLSYDNGTLFLLTSQGEIDKFTLTETTLTRTTGKFTKSDIGLSSSDIYQISHQDETMFILSSSALYKVNTTTLSNQEITLSTSVSSISYEGNNLFALNSNNTLFIVSNSSEITTKTLTHGYTLSGLSSSSDNIAYISSPNSHQMLEYNLSQDKLTDLKVNETILPAINSANNFRYITLNKSTSLYLQPYSVTPKLGLEAGSKLTIIGSAPGEYSNEFYYVLIETATKNEYLYLKKETNDTNFSETLIQSAQGKFVAIRRVKLYSFPSINKDSLNIESESFLPQTEFEANSEIISSGINSFLKITMPNGEVKFAPAESLQPLKSAVELTLKCNAKTKRETTLTENENGTGEIIKISKNTRIKLLEEVSPNKKYIKASYQTESGITYTGYIFTEDVDPDGLSTLQILGLILIIINILVLMLIVIIKQKSRKWKLKTN